MRWLLIIIPWLIAILIIRSRRRSIVGLKAQRKYFKHLADELHLQFRSDEYFVQLEGNWNDFRVAILPHQFEGPGSVTLIYMETKIPAVERNWIEPNVGLGRALVEKNFGYEVTGDYLPSEKILSEIKKTPYCFVAITLPTRFVYSPLLQTTGWKNFVVLIALDEGRMPPEDRVRAALNSAEAIANVVTTSH